VYVVNLVAQCICWCLSTIIHSSVGLGIVLEFYNSEKFVTSPSSLFGNMLYTGPAASMLPRLMTKWQQTWHST